MSLYHHLVEGTLDVEGTLVHWYDSEHGDPDEPPVVLLHGTSGPAEASFWALFPMLAFTRRVITFDFGLPPDSVPLTLDHYVAQAAAVADDRSPDRPVALVGHSLGAVVAAALAAQHADRVAALVLIAGWLRTDRQQLLRNDIWRHLNEEGSAALADFGLFTAYGQPFLVTRTERDYTALRARAGGRVTSPRVMELNRGIDISAECGSITAPTLVVGASHDQMVPVRHSHDLLGAIADSRYTEIASGHSVVNERPGELFVHIDRFIADPHAVPAGTVLAPQPV